MHKRHEDGFCEEDLIKEFNLSKDQVNWYLKTFRGNFDESKNLARFLPSRNGKHFCTLTDKGMSRYFEFKKPWHEKTLGKITFLIIGAVITLAVQNFHFFIALLKKYI